MQTISRERINLTKEFLESRLFSSLKENSETIVNGKGDKFLYIKEQSFVQICSDLSVSIEEYMNYPFWDSEGFVVKSNEDLPTSIETLQNEANL